MEIVFRAEMRIEEELPAQSHLLYDILSKHLTIFVFHFSTEVNILTMNNEVMNLSKHCQQTFMVPRGFVFLFTAPLNDFV